MPAQIAQQTNNESILINIDKISKSVKKEDIQALISAIDTEIGNHKLEKEEIAHLQSLMNIDALEAAKWQKVADVLKYLSPFAIAEIYPETSKKIIEITLILVGIFFPIAGTAQGLLSQVPTKLFSALVKIGAFATPEYLLYRGANMIANKKLEKAKRAAESDMRVFESMTTLIVVCKNKLLSMEMSKRINANNDLIAKTVAGSEARPIHTIIWNESAWEAFRDKLTDADRVLIIGNLKNTVPLTSEQVRFDKYGVKYGWAGNIATIEANPKVLSKSKIYKEFLAEMDAFQISETLTKNKKPKFDWVTAGKIALFPPLLIGDILRASNEVKNQQFLFGLYALYMQDLPEFLNTNKSLPPLCST